MNRKLWILCIAYALSLPAHLRAESTLYSEIFDLPSSPTFEIAFGQLETVGPTALFATKSLRFNSLGNPGAFYYDQIRFRVDTPNSPYQGIGDAQFQVTFDLYTEHLLGSTHQFAAFLDSPGAFGVVFGGDGNVVTDRMSIYQFADHQLMKVAMTIDTRQEFWSVAINGSPLFFSTQFPVGGLRTVRFSLGAKSAGLVDDVPAAYVDNIRITSQIPEPTGLAFTSVPLAVVVFPLFRLRACAARI